MPTPQPPQPAEPPHRTAYSWGLPTKSPQRVETHWKNRRETLRAEWADNDPPQGHDTEDLSERTLPGDPFGDLMDAPGKYVVPRTLERPTWRDTTIIPENVIESVRALKALPGRHIVTDGSGQLVHALQAHDLVDELDLSVYPLTFVFSATLRVEAPTAWRPGTSRREKGLHDGAQVSEPRQSRLSPYPLSGSRLEIHLISLD